LTFSDTKVTSRDKTLLPYNMEGFKGIDNCLHDKTSVPRGFIPGTED
jgi:hypothetical protein